MARFAFRNTLVCLLLALLATVTGCGGTSTKSTAGTPRICSVGTTYTCIAPRGCAGLQRCSADGASYTVCDCNLVSIHWDGGAANGGAADGGTADAGGVPDSGRKALDAGVDAAIPGQEICDNGKDDNGDGKVDCADSACAQLECVPAAPTDWQGPVALFVGTDAAQSCAAAYATAAINGGSAASGAPATCSSCQCTAPSACASFLDFRVSAANSCGAASACTTPVNAQCTELTSCLTGEPTVSLEARLPAGQAGCTASAAAPVVPAASWSVRTLACAAPHLGAGCQVSEVCAPRPPATPFLQQLCIYKSGDVACPAEHYTEKRVVATKLSDSRSCAPCSCSVSGCSYKWQTFDPSDTSCTSPMLTQAGGQCIQISPVSNKLRLGVGISGIPQCAVSGGTAQGTVSADDPVTVCCEP